MDVLKSLILTGEYFNDHEESPQAKPHTNTIKRTNLNCDNIYNSNQLKKNKRNIKRNIKAKTNESYKKSRFPNKTGVVEHVRTVGYRSR